MDVCRAAAYPPTDTAMSPIPTRIERADGRNRQAGDRPRGSVATAARARGGLPCARRRRRATRVPSTRRPHLLRRGHLDVAEKLDLMDELDPELLPCAAPGLPHQREGVCRPRATGVLDEVRVLRRDLRPADAVALEAAGLEHAPGRELMRRVLEDAAERAPVRRLGVLATGVELAHLRLDLCGVARPQRELRLHDDLPVAKVRVPVGEAELRRREPARAVRGRDERALEDPREVT